MSEHEADRGSTEIGGNVQADREGVAAGRDIVGDVHTGTEIIVNPQASKPAPPAAHISDIQVARDASDRWRVDFRVSNRGGSTLLLDRAAFEVQDAALKEPLMSHLEPSAVYELNISTLHAAGQVAEVPVAQAIEPGGVDRFVVVLIAAGYGSFVWRLKPKLLSNHGWLEGPVIEVRSTDQY